MRTVMQSIRTIGDALHATLQRTGRKKSVATLLEEVEGLVHRNLAILS